MRETKVSALLQKIDEIVAKHPEVRPAPDGWMRLSRESIDGALCAIITMAVCSEPVARLVTGESDCPFLQDARVVISWYLTNILRHGHAPQGRAVTLDIAFPTAACVGFALRMRYETNEWYEPGRP